MTIKLEHAIAYLTGLYMTMESRNTIKENDQGEEIDPDEKILAACLKAVLTDVKINQFKEK